MVVLDARTGALKWWNQMLPNDGLDLDLAAAPMLYWNSRGEPMVAQGSKDGHLYGINRETRERVYVTPVTTITKPERAPTSQGVHSCPGPVGGVDRATGVVDTGGAGVHGVDLLAVLVRDGVVLEPDRPVFWLNAPIKCPTIVGRGW